MSHSGSAENRQESGNFCGRTQLQIGHWTPTYQCHDGVVRRVRRGRGPAFRLIGLGLGFRPRSPAMPDLGLFMAAELNDRGPGAARPPRDRGLTSGRDGFKQRGHWLQWLDLIASARHSERRA